MEGCKDGQKIKWWYSESAQAGKIAGFGLLGALG